MTDVMTKVQRSALMSRVLGRGNRSTELKMLGLMRASAIKGWRRHLDLPGRPDFAFPNMQLAIFVDGCFWHGCPRCYQSPKSNALYWKRRIHENKARDRRVGRLLRKEGWQVLRIWECDLAKRSEWISSRLSLEISGLRDGVRIAASGHRVR